MARNFVNSIAAGYYSLKILKRTKIYSRNNLKGGITLLKRIALYMLTLILSILAICSCTVGNKDDSEVTADPDAIWGPGISLYIIKEQGSSLNENKLLQAVAGLTGIVPKYTNDERSEQDHEFLFGRVNRPNSEYAYRLLEEYVDIDGGEHGWLIYSRGGSLAVAYSSSLAMVEAAQYIEDNYYTRSTLKFDEGIVKYDHYLLSERAEETNAQKKAEAFERLRGEVGDEITDAIEDLYMLYSTDVYVWMANLYDPRICVCETKECQGSEGCTGTGGFYYSNSGRDNVGFLPDIESTSQILNHLENGGMFDSVGGKYQNAITDQMKKGLLYFAKSLQSPEDGYFYHPQWGTEIIDARRGRDFSWAKNIIGRLGGKPKWNTPGNTDGEAALPGSSSSASFITEPISNKSTVTAVSKVIATSYSSFPWYLQSVSNWKKYITEELNILEDPYTTGNTLAANHNSIEAADKLLWVSQGEGRKASQYTPSNPAEDGYIEFITNYLTENQNQETGFWGEGVSYVTMNGFMKLSYSYTYYNHNIPNIDKALDSTIEILLSPDTENLHVCNTYNTWVNFSTILDIAGNPRFYDDDGKTVNELRAKLIERFPELIVATNKKIGTHRRSDNCFSYFKITCANTSQKALVGCATTPESDVNATSICTGGIVNNVFEVLGVESVPLYYHDDYLYFMEIIGELDLVMKTEIPIVETETFDSFNSTGAETEQGVVLYPGSYVTNELNNDVLGLGGMNKYFGAEVVADPAPKDNNDRALKINNYTYPVEGGKKTDIDCASAYSNTVIDFTNSVLLADCYSYSMDMYVNEVENGKCFMQLFLQQQTSSGRSHIFALSFYAYQKNDKWYFMIGDNVDQKYVGLDGVSNTRLVTDVPCGEWINFRMETYKIFTTIEGTTKRTLEIYSIIYINDQPVAVSDAARVDTDSLGETYIYDRPINNVLLTYYKSTNMEMYLDNIHAEKVDKKYEEPSLPEKQTPIVPQATNSPSGTGIYYTDTANKVGARYDFNGTVGLPGVSPGIYANNYYVVQSETENAVERVLYFYRLGIDTLEATGHEYIQLNGQAMNETELAYENPAYVFEADILFGGIPAFESVNGNYVVMMRLAGQNAKADVYLSTDKDGKLKFIQAVESSHYVPLEQDKWYNMRFEFYTLDAEAKQGRIKVYVDGEFSIELDAVDFAARSGSYTNNVIIQLQKAGPEAYVLLDNVYMGHENKEFVASREIVPNHYPADNISGTHDGGEIFNNTEEYAGIRVPVEPHAMKPTPAYGDYTGTYVGEDGYVYFYRTGKGGSQDFVKYALDAAPEIDNLCFIYEADMALGRVDSGTTYFSQVRLNANGRNAHVYIHVDANGKIYFNLMQGSAATEFTPLEQNQWYNIRLEFYFLSDEIYDGAIMVKAYVDGVYAADLVANGTSETTYNRVLIYAQNNESDGYVALDNLFFGYVSKEYVAAEGVTVPTPPAEEPDDTPDTPTTPEVTEPQDSIYSPTGEYGKGVLYNSDVVSGDTRYAWDDLANDKALASGNTVNAITYMTKQGYMVFERVAGTTAPVNMNMPFGEAPAGKLGNRVEFDAAFFNVDGLFLQIGLATSNGKNGQIYFNASENKISVSQNTIDAGENIALDAGAWYNLRFDYWLCEDGNVKVILYVNGVEAAALNAIETKTDSADYVKVTLRKPATETAILIDNLYTGFTTDAYEIPESIRPPEPPEIILPDISGTRGEGEYASDSSTVNYNNATTAPTMTAPGRTELFTDDSGDKFVWFGKWIHDDVKNAQSNLVYNHSTRPTDATGNLLELDIAFGNFSDYTTTDETRIGAAGLKIVVYDGEYKAEIYFYADDNGKIAVRESASPIISGKNISLDENTWYNLTLKCCEYVYDGKEWRVFMLYVNGEYYCDVRAADVSANTKNNYTALTLCQFEYDDYVLVDNVYTGYHAEEYVDPGFRLNDFEGDNAVIPPTTSIKSGSSKYAVEFAIENFMNSNRLKVIAPKVYEGDTEDTSLINNGNNEWSFYSTGSELDANCAVWESDIIIAPDAATSGKIYTINIRNASSVLLSFNIYLDGTTLKLDDTYELGSTNEAISLKLVYKVAEAEGAFYPSADVYVGDNPITTKTSTTAYEADAISVSNLARVHMTSNPAADGYIYFDNYRFVKLYDESLAAN